MPSSPNAVLSDPQELFKLFKTHPTYRNGIDLLDCYIDVVQRNPYCANELAFALSYLNQCLGKLEDDDYYTVTELFSRELFHRHGLGFSDDTKAFGPTNTFLITSLLSGLSLKYKLTDSSDQYGNIQDGLNVVDHNSPTSEVPVIGACIQLLIYGSGIVPTKPFIQSADEVANKLKTQKSMGTVKNPNALKVLEVRQLFVQIY